MTSRKVLPHAALLFLAAAASVFVWLRDKKAVVTVGEVTVWNARAADVERIAFDTKGKKLALAAQTDAHGRWFLGMAEPLTAAGGPDAGPPPPKVSFVSVTQANKVAEGLAPLKALREVGKIGEDRDAEFGLKEPEGKLSVTIAGKERSLTLGGRTPGGADRYVRDDGSNVVYVIKNEVTRDLASGESSLTERDTHGFKDPDIQSVRVVARGKTREILRRGPDSKRIWADPSEPDKADETFSNWMAKVDRLKPTEYLAAPPAAPEIVVRIEYKAKDAPDAFLEIAKVPSSAPAKSTQPAPSTPKSDFLVRSERTRRWAKVYAPVGEQVEQDLGSVLR